MVSSQCKHDEQPGNQLQTYEMLRSCHGFPHMAVDYQEESALNVVHEAEVVNMAKVVKELKVELKWELGSRLW